MKHFDLEVRGKDMTKAEGEKYRLKNNCLERTLHSLVRLGACRRAMYYPEEGRR